MKFITPLIIVFLFFTGCSNLNLGTASIDSKKNLIENANNADIGAMADLAKYYNFPQTKEGLYLFNKWYDTILKSDEPKQIVKVANAYYENKDMFIDGEKKALALYKKAYKLNDTQAAIELIKFYANKYDKDKSNEILNKVLNKLSKEQVISLYNYYDKKYSNSQKEKLFKILEKTGYKKPFNIKFNKFKRDYYRSYRTENKNSADKFMQDVIESKDVKNMLKIAQFLKNKYKYKEALNIYNKIIKLEDNAEAYYDISDIYKRGNYRQKINKDKEKSLKYLKKAAKLNNKDAAKKLLQYYSQKLDYIDDYEELKNSLSKTQEGKLILANFYKSKGLKDKSSKLYNELAKDDNKEAIIELASKRVSSYNFNPEEYKIIKKWRDYVLNSDNIELKKALLEEFNKRYYSRKNNKKIIEELNSQLNSKKNQSEINILDLRKLGEKNLYRDPKKAIEYYEKAASYGDVYSKRKLAKIYLRKEFQQYDKSVEILSSLMKQGDYKAGQQLIRLYRYPSYLYKKDLKKAIKIYEYYAKQDDINSIDKLKDIYLCGSCSEEKVDYKKAYKYVKKLIKLRHDSYDYANLGWMYHYGKGVKVDLQKAKENYLKAVELGNYGMYYNLAWLYYKEKGNNDPIIRLDYKEAKKYLEEGVKHNSRKCMNLLGVFYKKGLGVKKDMEKAVQYFKPIAKYEKYAGYHLAKYYENKKMYKKAAKYFEYSAKQGKASSQIELGILYEKGLGVPKDVEKAILYYQDAYANKNDTEDKDVAAYNIGLVYEYGKAEYKKDYKKAIKWYKRSNYKKAKEHLKKLQKAKK
ncbi:tetratricopeptide repeat protein [Arcobacter sp. CECT 8985]|uniref:SEL1-like repeat protein n=1 Tax=Arcobacter sp. CECT 8985 TaxID=1935424 RepID=UPI00100BED1B|nr:tetratricopeptide repeat protein [Arcobacter sp. CECT 8985]RXJ86190.1 hypothetical protein CRU93_09545 [Arcobacter sp. CECT 8985]